MTISYNLDVSRASAFSFFRLLFRWKASIWKIALKELFVWTILFLIISFIYRTEYFLTSEQKMIFEDIAHYFNTRLDFIPLTFILGFFVNIIMTRWSSLFDNMGYIENYAIRIGNYIRGDDGETRLMRRAMARYLVLTQVLIFRDISIKVRKRFPTYDSIVKAGILLEEEKNKLNAIKIHYDKYWAPTNWIYSLIFKARSQNKITHDILASKLCDEIKEFRYNLQLVCNYDWVPLPLVYPQVIFLAVYVYFGVCLISRQFIFTERNIDLILPLMTMIQFFFFVGWLKIAQGLLNPFGTDDDDFECNFLIDKNLATSLCIVDAEYDNPPEIKEDIFWKKPKFEPIYPFGEQPSRKMSLTSSASNFK
ncbi:unnamed protein product [Dracunculus medinensis]|uniref:Bestrophin homolog n=1 Tax=Dracunculus medinensis TaxID=318479 RepID=A0A0N4UCH3_DRAME|nr:unnamed protein product [Dracunculus medinensis]